MITLHHLEYSQSFRILWLLEELGAEYELKTYNRDPQTRLAPAEYKAISPLGTAPVITDGDLALAESSAIMDYILDSYPDSPLRPGAGDPDRARHLFWFHAAQGSLMSTQMIEMMLGLIEKRSPFPLSKLFAGVFNKAREGFTRPRLKAILDLAEKHLGEKLWFGGRNLTAADIVLIYSFEAMFDRGVLTKASHPNIAAWLERVKQLPSYKKAREIDDRPTVSFAL